MYGSPVTGTSPATRMFPPEAADCWPQPPASTAISAKPASKAADRRTRARLQALGAEVRLPDELALADLGDRALGDNLAGGEHNHPLGGQPDQAEVVLDEQDADALAADRREHPGKRLELLHADTRGRLVDEQDLRLGGEGGGEAGQAALGARQRGHRQVRRVL